MRSQLFALTLLAAPVVSVAETKPAPDVDPYLWLEEIDAPKAMDWVKAKNADSVKQIGSTPRFEATKDQILGVLDSDARIPFYERMNDGLYNFWKDKEHPRGLWRRTTLDEYRKDKPNWETLIDVDALGKEEKESWVFHGARCMRPEYQHCLILLSRGGADASVVREYDLKTKSFVKGGFTLPEAKTEVDWIDANTLYVETDFGPGSMTASGYPRVVKQWKRGTPLSAATVVYEAKHEDLTVSASHDPTVG